MSKFIVFYLISPKFFVDFFLVNLLFPPICLTKIPLPVLDLKKTFFRPKKIF